MPPVTSVLIERSPLSTLSTTDTTEVSTLLTKELSTSEMAIPLTLPVVFSSIDILVDGTVFTGASSTADTLNVTVTGSSGFTSVKN